MSSQSQLEQRMPVDGRRLTSMIDKLVAVQLDLKPLCGDPENKVQKATARTTIVEACEVLQSAIEDLKQVIFSLEGFPGMMESPPSSSKASGSE